MAGRPASKMTPATDLENLAMLNHLFSARLMLTSVLLTMMLGPPVAGQVIVVPNSLASLEGNSHNAWPFDIGEFPLSSQRYQQVYASSQFADIVGPVAITQIRFRPSVVG